MSNLNWKMCDFTMMMDQHKAGESFATFMSFKDVLMRSPSEFPQIYNERTTERISAFFKQLGESKPHPYQRHHYRSYDDQTHRIRAVDDKYLNKRQIRKQYTADVSLVHKSIQGLFNRITQANLNTSVQKLYKLVSPTTYPIYFNLLHNAIVQAQTQSKTKSSSAFIESYKRIHRNILHHNKTTGDIVTHTTQYTNNVNTLINDILAHLSESSNYIEFCQWKRTLNAHIILLLLSSQTIESILGSLLVCGVNRVSRHVEGSELYICCLLESLSLVQQQTQRRVLTLEQIKEMRSSCDLFYASHNHETPKRIGFLLESLLTSFS